jgi:hypothetical protein
MVTLRFSDALPDVVKDHLESMRWPGFLRSGSWEELVRSWNHLPRRPNSGLGEVRKIEDWELLPSKSQLKVVSLSDNTGSVIRWADTDEPRVATLIGGSSHTALIRANDEECPETGKSRPSLRSGFLSVEPAGRVRIW